MWRLKRLWTQRVELSVSVALALAGCGIYIGMVHLLALDWPLHVSLPLSFGIGGLASVFGKRIVRGEDD